MELVLEKKSQKDDAPINMGGGIAMITPPINEDYWSYRVQVGSGQSIVGFPKFGTIGIGFAVEEDWNTNFPYTCSTKEIWTHIKGNKGAAEATDLECRRAIRMIQNAAFEDRDTVDNDV